MFKYCLSVLVCVKKISLSTFPNTKLSLTVALKKLSKQTKQKKKKNTLIFSAIWL